MKWFSRRLLPASGGSVCCLAIWNRCLNDTKTFHCVLRVKILTKFWSYFGSLGQGLIRHFERGESPGDEIEPLQSMSRLLEKGQSPSMVVSSINLVNLFFLSLLSAFSVHGRYSQWGSWFKCRVTCGVGYQFRRRTCTNPAPAYGGRSCVGSSVQIQRCRLNACPPSKLLTLCMFTKISKYFSSFTRAAQQLEIKHLRVEQKKIASEACEMILTQSK